MGIPNVRIGNQRFKCSDSVAWCMNSSVIRIRETKNRMTESHAFRRSMEHSRPKRQRKMAEAIIVLQ
jgi:hypothetical protein